MSLTPPDKVGKLRKALGDKAKASPSYRFYALYDKLYRRDILDYAYRRCKANAGVHGVDGMTFADVVAAIDASDCELPVGPTKQAISCSRSFLTMPGSLERIMSTGVIPLKTRSSTHDER